MQNLLKGIPLVLLLGLAPLAHGEPNIAQSIMLVAVATLFGYTAYLESLKKPDYVKIFSDRLVEQDLEIKKRDKLLLKELDDMRASQGKINLVKKRDEAINNFKW